MIPSSNLADQIIQLSTGPFGDFQMPTCVRLVESESMTRGWIPQMNWEVIVSILRRYKEHVAFWNISQNVIQREVEMFSNALARVGIYYSPGVLIQTLHGL